MAQAWVGSAQGGGAGLVPNQTQWCEREWHSQLAIVGCCGVLQAGQATLGRAGRGG